MKDEDTMIMAESSSHFGGLNAQPNLNQVPKQVDIDTGSAAVSLSAGLALTKKLRFCENSICPKAYIETGSEPKNFWTRRQLHGNKYSWLCDICSQAYKAKQFCDYCKQIYFDESEYQANDGKEWVLCERCNKWNHIDCEAERNNNPEIRQYLENNSYFCIPCAKTMKQVKP